MVFEFLKGLQMFFIETNLRGASKIILKKANKKRTVTVRRVIFFLNFSRHLSLI